MNGIERIKRAIALDGGYEYCEEHNTYRWWSPDNCSNKHKELPRGYFTCEEHGRIHTPEEQAWHCD